MDFYERQHDRAENKRESKERDEDFEFEQCRQRRIDEACNFYEDAVRIERMERERMAA
jgi:hypothetical protein